MVSPACAAALGQDILAWLHPAQVEAAFAVGSEQQDAPCCSLRCMAAAQQLLAAVATTQTQVRLALISPKLLVFCVIGAFVVLEWTRPCMGVFTSQAAWQMFLFIRSCHVYDTRECLAVGPGQHECVVYGQSRHAHVDLAGPGDAAARGPDSS